jgi:hypothetical protein
MTNGAAGDGLRCEAAAGDSIRPQCDGDLRQMALTSIALFGLRWRARCFARLVDHTRARHGEMGVSTRSIINSSETPACSDACFCIQTDLICGVRLSAFTFFGNMETSPNTQLGSDNGLDATQLQVLRPRHPSGSIERDDRHHVHEARRVARYYALARSWVLSGDVVRCFTFAIHPFTSYVLMTRL